MIDTVHHDIAGRYPKHRLGTGAVRQLHADPLLHDGLG
jgi:outer membrane protein assembly factor BamB